jgi:PiT family inorganic phosphate transporter
MIAGPVVVGRKFIRVLATDITHLDPSQGFSTTIGSATSDYTLTLFGIPSSFDSTTFGAVVGAGSSKGLSSVRTSMVRKIISIWILNIVISVITGYSLSYVLHTLGV